MVVSSKVTNNQMPGAQTLSHQDNPSMVKCLGSGKKPSLVEKCCMVQGSLG